MEVFQHSGISPVSIGEDNPAGGQSCEGGQSCWGQTNTQGERQRQSQRELKHMRLTRARNSRVELWSCDEGGRFLDEKSNGCRNPQRSSTQRGPTSHTATERSGKAALSTDKDSVTLIRPQDR